MDPDKTDIFMVGLVVAAAFLYVLKTMITVSDGVDTAMTAFIILFCAIAIGYLITRQIRGK